MKKFILSFSAFLLIISVLPSCGNSAKNIPEESTENETLIEEINGNDNSGNVQIDEYATSADNVWETYRMENGSVYIDRYNGKESVVTVPSEINGVTISGLTGASFSGNINITKVILPDTITAISTRAFYRCKNLERVELPDTLTYIGQYAFAECEKLDDIVLPRDIDTIGLNAFGGCSSLKKVNFEKCQKLTTISDSCFSFTGIEEVKIPECTTTLGNAFCDIDALKKAYIPSSVTSISRTFFDSRGVVLYVEKGSYAESYAVENEFDYVVQ